MNKAFLFLLTFFLLIPLLGNSHIPNQSYIYLRVYEKEGIDGRFEINTIEINKLFGTNFKKGVSIAELEPYIGQLKPYLLDNTAFSSKYGDHNIVLTDKVELFPGVLGDFVQIYFKLDNTIKLPEDIDVKYSAIFEKDDTHRGFLIIEYNWLAGVINNEANISLDFAPGDTTDTLSLTDVSVWNGFVAMIKQGVWHIWIGLDHILFLVALILPSVVRRFTNPDQLDNSKTFKSKLGIFSWAPVQKFKPAFWYILKVVTFFTIAHTITLSLASLELVKLPSRWVESIIAISIGLAAYHNIRPIFKGKDWIIAFVFGLFHGFGFASVLGDLGLTSEFLTYSLLGFNIGVEIGQVVIIALIFPILFLLRKSALYPKILVYGSILLILISLNWSIERVFEVDLGIYQFFKSILRRILVSIGLWS